MSSGEKDACPQISIIMPVYNAMPYLPKAVHDVLYQTGVRLELLAVDDGSDDGSYEFLTQLAELLGEAGSVEAEAERERKRRKRSDVNPATMLADRAKHQDAPPEQGLDPSDKQAPAPEHAVAIMSVKEVAAAMVGGHSMRVLSVGGMGQGAAMTKGLNNARASLIGQMESDDERPCNAFELLINGWHDAARKGIQAVCSQVELSGFESAGMTKCSRVRAN
eukprot:TRINITY_DN9554_c0_g1_i1.p1 TRINITY_DN9554_c0_g1~~TRINITY_DN9554_c0_g1_i1.p1  ORF type:complete len:221 (-),score=52.48 TRINITY_DN9554_c0_g1_i1:85-747(-)